MKPAQPTFGKSVCNWMVLFAFLMLEFLQRNAIALLNAIYRKIMLRKRDCVSLQEFKASIKQLTLSQI